MSAIWNNLTFFSCGFVVCGIIVACILAIKADKKADEEQKLRDVDYERGYDAGWRDRGATNATKKL